MEINSIFSYIGALGVGGLIGILIQSHFERRLSDKRMLFEARLKAYTGLTGRIFNLFLEPDVTILKEDALIFAKLNQLFSEAQLMASHELADPLGTYQTKVFEFHLALSKKDDSRSASLHTELVRLADRIHHQMRKDLHVDKKSVFK